MSGATWTGPQQQADAATSALPLRRDSAGAAGGRGQLTRGPNSGERPKPLENSCSRRAQRVRSGGICQREPSRLDLWIYVVLSSPKRRHCRTFPGRVGALPIVRIPTIDREMTTRPPAGDLAGGAW